MNLPTFVISAILVVIVVYDIRYLMKKGGCASCKGGCSSCKSKAHQKKLEADLKQAKKDIHCECCKRHE